MFKVIIPSVLILFLSGCNSTAPVKATSNSNTNVPFTYDPQDKEQFVFKEIAASLQKYSYKDICFQAPVRSVYSECSGNQLSYDKYVGKKGFYTDKKPIYDRNNHIVKEAILETGEVVFMVKSTKYKHVGSNIISLEEHNKVIGFKPSPIVPGAKTLVTGYSLHGANRLNVSSQNGHSFTEESLQAIRNIANRFPENGARVADILSTLKVDFDDFDGKVVVSGLPYNNKDSYLSAKIIFSKDGKATPFLVSHYENDNWLFVNKYSIAADDFRWKSKNLDFQRDNSSGKIWEWNNSYINDEYLTILNKIVSAKEIKIRFHGKQYYDDYALTQIQQKELSSLVELINLTKQG